jgi:hypothetical protein
MKRLSLMILVAALLLVPVPPAPCDPVSEYNATVTANDVLLMREPSFTARDMGIFDMPAGNKIVVLSRTSFTDRMAGVPQDYWYLVMERHCGAAITGYIHGSALTIDPGAPIPVLDPAGFVPAAVPAFERRTVTASIGKDCATTTGAIAVPPGKRAVRFRLDCFTWDFVECPEEPSLPPNGFTIAPVSSPDDPLFAYGDPEGAGPYAFDGVQDMFFSLDLGPGAYLVDVAGHPWLTLKITYDLVDAP